MKWAILMKWDKIGNSGEMNPSEYSTHTLLSTNNFCMFAVVLEPVYSVPVTMVQVWHLLKICLQNFL